MTKVLLVEDDKNLREIYGVRLLAEGYDIVSAGDGEEALAMAIKERPQLIVSDVMMPKISGFDMLDILRSTTETKNIKIIIMTALSSDEQRARGESLGADKYLVKSQVGIEDVVQAVHEVLGDSMMPKKPVAQVAPTGQAPSTPATPSPVASPVASGETSPVGVSQEPSPQAVPNPVVASIPVQTTPIQPTQPPQLVARPTPPPAPVKEDLDIPHAEGGERVINPLPQDMAEPEDISKRIEHELITEPPVPPMNTDPLPPTEESQVPIV